MRNRTKKAHTNKMIEISTDTHTFAHFNNTAQKEKNRCFSLTGTHTQPAETIPLDGQNDIQVLLTAATIFLLIFCFRFASVVVLFLFLFKCFSF